MQRNRRIEHNEVNALIRRIETAAERQLKITFLYGVVGKHVTVLPINALRLCQQIDTWGRSPVGSRNEHFPSVNSDWEYNHPYCNHGLLAAISNF